MRIPYHFFPYITIYEVCLLVALASAYPVVRHTSRTSLPRLSYLAVFSALCGVLNPQVIFGVLASVHLAPIVAGCTKITSCVVGFVAVVSALIALYRIRRAGGAMRGRGYAVVGLVTGLPWMLFWIIVLFLLAWGMSGVKG